MVRRAAIGDLNGTKVMRMSKPGIEVATADLDQLAFDRSSDFARPFMKGETTHFGVRGHQGGHGAPVFSVPFGVTFPRPPRVLFCFNVDIDFGDGNGYNWREKHRGNWFPVTGNAGSQSPLFYCRVYTDRIDVYGFVRTGQEQTAWTARRTRLNYIVFQD